MKQFYTAIFLIFNLILQAEINEGIMLTTDKHAYLSGENVLFSVVTTNKEGVLIQFSSIAYVELANHEQALSQCMVTITKGTGEGILNIPEYLPTGYYRLIAYTRQMLNQETDMKIEFIIAVINPLSIGQNQLTRKTDTSRTKVQQQSTQQTTLTTNHRRYQPRQEGVLLLQNLPENLSSYTLSIAAYLPVELAETDIRAISTEKPTNKQLPEYEGHIIRARIQEKLLEGEKLILSVPGKGPELFAGKAISQDEYVFVTRGIVGQTELATTVDAHESKRFPVEFISPYDPVDARNLPVLYIDSTCLPDILRRYVGLQLQKEFQPELFQQTKTRVTAGHFTPDWTYKLAEYTPFNTLEEVILEYVSNVRFRRIGTTRMLAINREGRYGYTVGNTLVLVDNVPVFTHELLLKYDASLIEQIDIYRGQYVFSGMLYDGIVAFSSYAKDFKGLQLDQATSISNYFGPQPSFMLKAPEQTNQHIPDLRTCLSWKTRESTQSPGITEIQFTTSDIEGSFKARLHGLTSCGELVEAHCFFEVKQ